MPDTTVYDSIVIPAAVAYAVPVEWVKAVIGAETSFQVPAPTTWEPTANEYSYGPMQVLLSTAQGLGFTGAGTDLAQPAQNIPVGTQYLAALRNSYGDDFATVYSVYNSGDPNGQYNSSTIAGNVLRAQTWLAQFTPSISVTTTPPPDVATVSSPISGGTAAGLGAFAVALIAGLLLFKKGK